MSASAEPCAVHEMPWCAECAPKPARAPIPRDHGPVVTAQHGGQCACCGESYEPGEQIVMSEFDGGWAMASHLEPQLAVGGVDFSDLL